MVKFDQTIASGHQIQKLKQCNLKRIQIYPDENNRQMSKAFNFSSFTIFHQIIISGIMTVHKQAQSQFQQQNIMYSQAEFKQPSTPKVGNRVTAPGFGSASQQSGEIESFSTSHNRAQTSRPPNIPQYGEMTPRARAGWQPTYGDNPAITRRQSEMITGLRTELLNIKSEVSKMLVKPVADKPKNAYNDDRSDTSSVSDVSQCLQRTTKNLVKATQKDRFMQVEMQSLRAQLKSVKRKYADRKGQHKEQVSRLNRKVEMLQQLLRQNQQKVEQYKVEIQQEIQTIMQQLVTVPQDRSKQVQSLRKYISELQAKLNNQQQQILTLQQNTSLQTSKITEQLEQQLCQLHQQYTNLHKQQQLSNVLIANYDSEMALLKQQLSDVGQQYEDRVRVFEVQVNEEREQYQQKISLIQLTIAELEDTIQKHQATIENQKETIEKLELVKKEHEEKNTAEALEKTKVLVEQNKLLTEEKKVVEEEHKGLKENYESLRETNQALVEEHKTLQQQFQVLQEQFKAVEGDHHQLQQQQQQQQPQQLPSNILQSRLDQQCQLNIAQQHAYQQLQAIYNQSLQTIQQLQYTLQQHNQYRLSLQQQIQQKDYQLETLQNEQANIVQQMKMRLCMLAQQQRQLMTDLNEKSKMSSCQEQQLKQLTRLYNEANEYSKRKQEEIHYIREEYQYTIDQMEVEINNLRNTIQNNHYEHKSIVDSLKMEINQSRKKNNKNEIMVFDEALKEQIQQNKRLKATLTDKNEEIYQLKDHISTSRSQFDAMKAQMEIDKLKSITQRKNIQVNMEIEIQNLKNQVDVERKTADSLSSKFRLIVDEVKKKDQFIQKQIIGRKLSIEDRQTLEQFFKIYELDFPINQVKSQLTAQIAQIAELEKINRGLMAEIYSLKELVAARTQTTGSSQQMLGSYPCQEVRDVQSNSNSGRQLDLNTEKFQEHMMKGGFSLQAIELKLTEETASLIGIETMAGLDLDCVDYE